jgi:8-oxo-dGTP pyrophosphatase MutT (NUDIX family)
MKGKLLKVEPISKKFHNVFRFTRRTAEVKLNNSKTYRFLRHVFETGPAVSVLPYFYDKAKKEWFVVLVKQYRPAVDAVCLEPTGGLTKKGANLKKEMARELFEEAGIRVNPSKIKIIGKQHLATSFCDQLIHLGIIDLGFHDSKYFLNTNKKNHGLINEKEFTEVILVSISSALNKSNLVTYTLAKYQILDLANRLKILK